MQLERWRHACTKPGTYYGRAEEKDRWKESRVEENQEQHLGQIRVALSEIVEGTLETQVPGKHGEMMRNWKGSVTHTRHDELT